jgi:hypothetical protein
MSAALSPLEQLEQQSSQGQPQQAAQPASGLSPLEQLEQMSAKPTQPAQGGPSTEEQQFLTSNPDHQWVSKHPLLPNTQPGIYSKSEAADMLKDPTMEHHPVDLQFAKHTAQAAGEAALATGGPIVAGAALQPMAALAEHLSGQILAHGTELATKYPNFVKLAGKLVPGLPMGTLAAITYAYEHFKK